MPSRPFLLSQPPFSLSFRNSICLLSLPRPYLLSLLSLQKKNLRNFPNPRPSLLDLPLQQNAPRNNPAPVNKPRRKLRLPRQNARVDLDVSSPHQQATTPTSATSHVSLDPFTSASNELASFNYRPRGTSRERGCPEPRVGREAAVRDPGRGVEPYRRPRGRSDVAVGD